MQALDKIFGQTKMGWPRVIIISILCGVIPGLIMVPEALEATSIHNIGVCFEFWVLAAMFIILNCEKPLEAALKTFVFFLISQPLIYLVQVPFSYLGWGLFGYYKRWFIMTLLTFPGAILAWYTKKGGLLAAGILFIMDVLLLGIELPTHLRTLLNSFPHQLLACALILFEVIFFELLLVKGKRDRIIALALAALILAGAFGIKGVSLKGNSLDASYELDGNAPFELVTENGLAGLDVSISGDTINLHTEAYGAFILDIRDADGVVRSYVFNYSGNQLEFYEME